MTRPLAAQLAPFAVLVLGACSPSVEHETGTTSEALSDERTLSDAAVANLLAKAGFPAATIPRMVCIGQYESGLNDLAARRRPNGTWDVGLFLINSVHVANTPGCPTKVERLYDAAENAKCAFAVYQMSAFRSWPSYGAHKADCDAYRLAR
ncbi:MAG: hypothetical protein IPG50_22065 [Myxococcales bacterium]|nr:hypothetical protein [Myxococcales bacterium]